VHRIACSECGHRLKYLDAQIGKKAKCQKCGHAFVLPAPQVEDVPEETPARPDPTPQIRQRRAPAVKEVPESRILTLARILVLICGMGNLLLAVPMLAKGPDGFGRNSNVSVPDVRRAETFYAWSGTYLAVNLGLTGFGCLAFKKERLGIYGCIGLLGLAFFVNSLYWFAYDIMLFTFVELAVVVVLLALCAQSLRGVAQAEAKKEVAELLEGGESGSPLQGLIALLQHEKSTRRIEALRRLAEMGADAREAVPAISEVIVRAVPPTASQSGHCEMCGVALTMWNRNVGTPQCGNCAKHLLAAQQDNYSPRAAEVAAETLERLGAVAVASLPALKKGVASKNPLLAQRCRKAIAVIERKAAK